jgi:hypothetical protein
MRNNVCGEIENVFWWIKRLTNGCGISPAQPE